MTKTYSFGVYYWFSKFGSPAIIPLGTIDDGPIVFSFFRTLLQLDLKRGYRYFQNGTLPDKLGASPQLECWNTEILKKWVLASGS